jgi:hypothetical protein
MEIAFYQLIAYVLLSIASVIVAVTSAVMGYRQIFGWHPTLFVTGIGSAKQNNTIVTFEVWNRRKYPIAISGGSSINFGKTKLSGRKSNDGWHRWRNTMTYYGDKIKIEPLSFQQIVVQADFADGSRDSIDDKWLVEVKYFDPVSNKEMTASAVAHYKMEDTGATRA